MRSFLFTFAYDDVMYYETYTAPSAIIANCYFEREYPNAVLKHVMIMN